MLRLVTGRKYGAVYLISVDNPPINALCRSVRTGLLEEVKTGVGDDDIKILAIFCKGRTFCAGADIKELETGLEEPGLLELIQLTERINKPVVAALHGYVYGGGLIVAIAADYRIAAPATKFAMPEVGLGLLPTFGGTQYLPRLVGMEAAAEMIVDERVLTTEEAWALGLVDAIAESSDMEQEARVFSKKLLQEKTAKRFVRDRKDYLEGQQRGRRLLDQLRSSLDPSALETPAKQSCIDLLQDAFDMPLEQALRREHKLFLELLTSENSVILRRCFFAQRQRKF